MVVPGKEDVEALPYDVETPLPPLAQPSQEVKRETSPVLEETKVVSGGTTNEPAPRLLPNIDGTFLHFPYSVAKGQFIDRRRDAYKRSRG